MKQFLAGLTAATLLLGAGVDGAITNALPARGTNHSDRLLRPLSLAEALDMALQQNSAIRKSQADLEATQGIVVQTRAIALPRVAVNSAYSANEESAVEHFDATGGGAMFANAFNFADQRWSADIRLVQSIYEGGRIYSALRSARLTREQALLNHQTVIADALRDVRVAYYGDLMAQQQIAVQQAS